MLLREVLDRSGVEYEAVEGEAAFYGPKIDVQIADPMGRESTLSTVQVALRMRDGRRLDARPAAEVLRRIGMMIDAHSTDLIDQMPALRGE